MRYFLAPGIMFMNKLRYAYKFGLVSLFFVLPIAVLIVLFVMESNAGISFAQKEQKGASYLLPIKSLIGNTQQHRGMMAGLLSGDPSFASKTEAKRKEIEQAAAQVDAIDKRYGQELGTSAQWKSIKDEWQSLRSRLQGITPKESLTAHTALIGHMLDLLIQIADSSNITLDPNIDSYYIADALVNRLTAMSETLGQARAVGSAAAAHGSASINERVRLAVLQNDIRSALAAVAHGVEAAGSSNPELKNKLAADMANISNSVNTFLLATSEEIIDPEKTTIAPKDFFKQATGVIGTVFRFYDSLSPELDGLLQARIDKFKAKRQMYLSFVVLMLALTFYLYTAFYSSVTSVLKKLNEFAGKIAVGDLSSDITITGKDEVGELSKSMQVMQANVQTLIKDMAHMSTEHDAGDIDVKIDETKFENDFQVMAKGVNTMAHRGEEKSHGLYQRIRRRQLRRSTGKISWQKSVHQ